MAIQVECKHKLDGSYSGTCILGAREKKEELQKI